MATLDNPLLHLGFEIPFDLIRAEHVEPGLRSLIELSGEALHQIESVQGPRTYDNTLGALDSATAQLEVAMTVVGHLESVANTPELRAAYNAVKPEVNAFFSSIPLRPALWKALRDFAATPAAGELSPARARFLKKTLDDFRRHGAELPDDRKERLQQITRELAELTSRFGQNVLDETAAYELVITDEARLSGLPDSARSAARESARNKGKEGYRFTLQAPSLIPLLTYLDDAEIRRQVYVAYNGRATSGEHDNTPLLNRVLQLRSEKARLLGYANFAELVLEDRMAGSASAARAFVKDLTDRTRDAFERETRALQEFRRGLEGEEAPELRPWDLGYYAEKQRQALYDFDEEQLRAYFPLEQVVRGLFETARRLYGVEITENEQLSTWHPDVRAYDIHAADGTFMASFYADFFPREEKRGGAWMNGIISGVRAKERREPHLGLICCNVTPAVGDRPPLLTHQEVITLFHEFGHLLHHCLSEVEVRSLAGTNVAWDFVELPSQIMENWCWEREALDTFAKHFESGEAIPDSLLEKMRRARTYREATAQMRQLGFAAVDLALHIDYVPAEGGDVLGYARGIMQEYAPARYPEDYAMIASFSHLFSSSVGYASGYYSYKWAEVLDADAFSRFQSSGVFDRSVGEAFRAEILSRGDSADPMELYKNFMGREPKLDALLRRAGLLTETAA